MSISGVTGADLRGLFHQRRVDFKAMTSAVESGDSTAAQTALQNYQKDVQSVDSAVGSTESSGSSDFATQIKTDLSNLTAAVQSGNVSDAQTALKAYEQDKDALFQSASEPGGDAASVSASDLSKLVQPVQSADTSSVQSDAAGLPNRDHAWGVREVQATVAQVARMA